ncbi:MAG: hypothetical protein V4707_11330 [Pseudomonadota bacterium]
MKRHTVLCAVIALSVASGLAACGDREAETAAAEGATTSGWAIPPRIDSVVLAQATLIFKGQAQPGGRVVLRSADGAAYAAVADDKGGFDIRMAAPTGPVMLTPETQVGQEASPAPQRLVILDGGRGPIALVTPGAPARRLNATPSLGAVDADGRSVLVSGRTAPGGEVSVQIDDRPSVAVQAGPDGNWSLPVEGVGARRIAVEGDVFAYPGAGPAGRAGEGWRVDWTAPDGARQSTWLPDA